MASIPDAVAALGRGELVAYPTETVYGLGADATDPVAVADVFDLKGRDPQNPLSVALGSVANATRCFALTESERGFLETFCPGPVTLVCARPSSIPPVVTGGRERVGIRIPDHPVALDLLDHVAPITATSANPSGESAPRVPAGLAPSIREGVAVVVGDDDTKTNANAASIEPSTVVDVERDTIHRRGAMAGAVETFLHEGVKD